MKFSERTPEEQLGIKILAGIVIIFFSLFVYGLCNLLDKI